MKWGMVIDLDRCTACQACVAACRIENNVPFQGEEQIKNKRGIFWMQVLSSVEAPGHYEHARAKFLPRPCMHCEEPPCVKVCPVEATYKNPEGGQVLQRYERCIGCKYCMVACPYGVRYFNFYRPTFMEPMNNYVNPDVQVRPIGVVEKCTFCIQRVSKAVEKAKLEGRALKDGDAVTACMQTCTGGAIKFGDLDDHNSLVHKMANSKRAYQLLDHLGTHPQVYYLTEG